MDLTIKKDKRNRGRYINKTIPGTQAYKAKATAIKDISEEVRTTNFYSKNYLIIEYKVMQMLKYDFTHIPI